MAIKRLGVTVFEKACRGPCGRTLPLSAFHRNGRKWIGRCGECRNASLRAARHAGRHALMVRKFWSKVQRADDGACWPWIGALNNRGYGTILRNGWARAAHRASWILANGPIPDGLCVLHRCDNPPCVNPAHLFLGTNADNIADMVAKRRQAPPQLGSANPSAKLTEAQVVGIRQRLASGEGRTALAAEFCVTYMVISMVERRRSWRHC